MYRAAESGVDPAQKEKSMRKMIMLAAATALAVVVGSVAANSAAAKTVTVTITKNGYVPNSLTIAQGDTVQFTNSDTVAHQVTFKSTAGVTCSPNPLVLQPTAGGSCTFQNARSYSYSDPNAKGKTFKGTITVTATPASLSLTAKPLLVIYGGHVVLSGALSTQTAGENVDVLAQQCGASSATKTATVQTTTAGAYSSTVQPLMNTAYTTKSKAATSSAVTVRVRPRLRLARVAPHRYSLRVSAAQSFAGKYANFQRYNGTRWVAVKSVLLRANTTGVAPTVLSTATFRSAIKARLRVRVVLGTAQVGTCYLPGTSNTILS
jgi:plastocyanin